ncbi:hypothetical protein H5410_027011 [Solanum commersonii]|uniref:Uncharacterized protein n=1 Tax=Solanum commersonii TaxID=4109 RepID=A0A9J5Z0R0_SOLCO|nr:hypothetical protein H5410_027011 [Solanum commersonii]
MCRKRAKKFKQVFIVFENLCYSGSLGTVSRDRRYTRRSAFWSISSPSCFSLQSLRALSRWEIWYCFAELLGDTPIAPFHRQLDLSLQGSAHCNKRRSQADRQLVNWARRSSGLHFFALFSCFVPSCQVVSMLCLKL